MTEQGPALVVMDGEPAAIEAIRPGGPVMSNGIACPHPSMEIGPRRERSRTVLVVEDEDGVRLLLVRWLEADGYVVVSVRGADDALRRLEASPAAVVVCDIRMPGHDGLWLAARIRRRFPETAVIMASGVQDVEASIESMRHGVLDYLVKPFGRDRLRDAVRHALEWHEAASESRGWRERLERELAARAARLRAEVHALVVRDEHGVDAMLARLTRRDHGARGHAVRVALTARATGARLGLGDHTLDVLGRAALLHDIGKLALPEVLLHKPAALTADERAVVRRFPQVGAEIVGLVPYLAAAAPLVRDAQERMDGEGYPRGVPASIVPLAARVIGVADAFDTMTHARAFRASLPEPAARRELARCSGAQFDPAVVAAFLQTVGGR